MSYPSRQQARVYARGLGWFSLALGAAELLAARPLARAIGLPRQAAFIRACGLREIATGLGLLKAHDVRPWLWARVAGDAADLAALGAARARPATAVAVAAVAGVAVIDVACARALQRPAPQPQRDYSGRSGWPRAADGMRGAAVAGFETPRDLATPPALQPWRNGQAAPASPVSAVLPDA